MSDSVSQPGYIDGILSTHFDECSIAAADAARLANERITRRNTYRSEVQPVGRDMTEGLEAFEFQGLGDFTINHEAVAGGWRQLS